jgi:hypothetical protein
MLSFVCLDENYSFAWSYASPASREDILRNPYARNIVPQADRAKSYKPDLRYLNENAPNSLAGRLARKLETPQKAAEEISPSSDTSSLSTTMEQPFVDYTVAQRRAARLAREEASKSESQEMPMQTSPSTAIEQPIRDNIAQRRAARLDREAADDSEKRQTTSPEQMAPSSISVTMERAVDYTIAQRKAARIAREYAARFQLQHASPRDVSPGTQSRYKQPLWQSTGSEKLGPTPNDRDEAMAIHSHPRHSGQQFRRGNAASFNRVRARGNAGRRSLQGSRDMAARPGATPEMSVPSQGRGAPASEETSDNGDISLEALEEGGDPKEPAEFDGPDVAFADLDVVLGPTASNSDAISSRQRKGSIIDHPRSVQEGSGGDYARFAPYLSRDFLIYRKMSPVTHAQLVLSQRGDVPIIARHRVLEIVESSIGEAGTMSVLRA